MQSGKIGGTARIGAIHLMVPLDGISKTKCRRSLRSSTRCRPSLGNEGLCLWTVLHSPCPFSVPNSWRSTDFHGVCKSEEFRATLMHKLNAGKSDGDHHAVGVGRRGQPKLSWRGNVANQVTVGAAVVEGSYQGVEEQNDAFEEEELLSLKQYISSSAHDAEG